MSPGTTWVAYAFFTRLGRRAVFAGAITFALITALWIAIRQGRQAAEASYAIRRADARIRALQTAKDITGGSITGITLDGGTF